MLLGDGRKGKIVDLISIIWISKWGLINYGLYLFLLFVLIVGKFIDSLNAIFLEVISKLIISDSNLDVYFVLFLFLFRRCSFII